MALSFISRLIEGAPSVAEAFAAIFTAKMTSRMTPPCTPAEATAFHISPVRARIKDVSEHEVDCCTKLVFILVTLAKNLEKQSSCQATRLQGDERSPSAQSNDQLARYEQVHQLFEDMIALVEAEQNLRVGLLSAPLDGPRNMRALALGAHYELLEESFLKAESMFDAISEAATLSGETLDGLKPVPEETGDEEQNEDSAKD